MHPVPESRDISAVVRDARVDRGWSQEKLAELAGVGRQTIARLELGHQGISLGNLYKVLRVLSLNLALEREGQRG